MVLTLYGCVAFYEHALSPMYVVLSIFIFALTFPSNWSYSPRIYSELTDILSKWSYVVGTLLFFGYVANYLEVFSKSVILTWVLVTPLALLLTRLGAGQYLQSDYYLTKIQKKTVIVGFNELGVEVRSRIQTKPALGLVFSGFFDACYQPNKAASDIGLIGCLDDVSSFVKRHNIHQILIALQSTDTRLMQLLDSLKDTTASIYFVPDFFMTDLIQARIDEIDGMPIVALCETPFYGFNGVLKRLSDIVVALAILVLVFPLMLALSIAVKLSSKGPVIFKQRRYGLDGQEIVVYKFRTMTVMEDGTQVKQATQDDQRITPIGRWLRRTSLDELPQFVNVLQGRMSVVGPRPHAVSHNEMFRLLIKGYMVRHKVRPGITGWAQVNGLRGETDTMEKMQQRIEYDLEYLKKWSIGLDMKIIVKTIFCIFCDKNAY